MYNQCYNIQLYLYNTIYILLLLPVKIATLKNIMILQLILSVTRCNKCNSGTIFEALFQNSI